MLIMRRILHCGVSTRNRTYSVTVERLKSRSLIKLTGEDRYSLLQGLITNDVHNVDDKNPSLFTYFLNNRGRILYDALIYKRNSDELLIECDNLVRESLIAQIEMSRIRKKVNVHVVDDNVWVALRDTPGVEITANDAIADSEFEMVKNVTDAVYRDPRCAVLGVRIIAPSDVNVADETRHAESSSYQSVRYRLGIAEGSTELSPGQYFPLEANADYLRGVSFSKGCYIGQELTARTYHTGVVRKRLMPLVLSQKPTVSLPEKTPIATANGLKAGKLLGLCDETLGIALLRVSEALENAAQLKVGDDIPACTYKPFWWPT